jgi:hypothetical protein
MSLTASVFKAAAGEADDAASVVLTVVGGRGVGHEEVSPIGDDDGVDELIRITESGLPHSKGNGRDAGERREETEMVGKFLVIASGGFAARQILGLERPSPSVARMNFVFAFAVAVAGLALRIFRRTARHL